jgi:hypothetical protein
MTSKSDTETTTAKKAADPVGKATDPVPATILDIPANQPYPTGSPPQPTYAEINGLPKGG